MEKVAQPDEVCLGEWRESDATLAQRMREGLGVRDLVEVSKLKYR